ncbi:MAG: DUF6364 family protein [Bergeyella sp.]
MTTKLTLSIKKESIEKAKRYAKGTQRSVSEMVQKYFDSLEEVNEEKPEFSPKMKKLLSLLKGPTTYTDKELDNFRREYLEKKYS